MAFLPWAESLQTDGVEPRREAGAPPGGGQSRAADIDPGMYAQTISNHLFSAGLDLHFTLMTLHDGPGRDRVEQAITEIDDAIRDLRHLMTEIAERLALPPWLMMTLA